MITIFIYAAYAATIMLMIMSLHFAKRRTGWPPFHYWLVTPFNKRTPMLIHRTSWIISIASMEVAIILRSIELGYGLGFIIFGSFCMLFCWWLAVILFCWVVYGLRFFIKNPKYCLKPIVKWFKLEEEEKK